jgi:alpha-beta hydrolase superfamily lysophospholipase
VRYIELLTALAGVLGLGLCAYLSSGRGRTAAIALGVAASVLAANLALAETRLSLAAAGIGAAALLASGMLFLVRGKGRRRGIVLAGAAIETALIVSAFVFPVFSPIPLEGGFAVGRIGPFAVEGDASPGGAKRPLLLTLYYPSDEAKAHPKSAYLDGEAMFRAYGLPGIIGRYLGLARGNSHEGAPISGRAGSYPLVVFSHGIGDFPEEYGELVEGLASEGFIVATVNHSGYSLFARLPSGEVLPFGAEAVEAAMGGADKGKSGTIIRALGEISADQSKAVDWLLGEQGRGGPFSRIEPESVAVAGHSFGGAAAVLSLRRDGRFAAGVDLDGPLYGEALLGVQRPLLIVSSDKAAYLDAGPGPEARRASEIVRHYFDSVEACASSSRPEPRLETIAGSSHSSFGSLSSRSPFRYFDAYPASRDGRETIRIARKLVADFLADSLGPSRKR